MFGLCKDAEAPQLIVEVVHKRRNSRLNGAEIVVVKLLTLGRLCAEQRSAGVNEVTALLIKLLIYEKVLLLGTDG